MKPTSESGPAAVGGSIPAHGGGEPNNVAPATAPPSEPGGAAIPNAPGEPIATRRAIPRGLSPDVPAAERAEGIPGVDEEHVGQISGNLAPILRDAIADALGVAADTIQDGATYFAPMIARQMILENSADTTTRLRAEGHRRHLEGQLLMNAAARGIPLQQRQEARFLQAVRTVMSTAKSLLA